MGLITRLIARTLSNLGGAWNALGDFRKAMSYFGRCTDIFTDEALDEVFIYKTLFNRHFGASDIGATNPNPDYPDIAKAFPFQDRWISLTKAVDKEETNHLEIVNTLLNQLANLGAISDKAEKGKLYKKLRNQLRDPARLRRFS